MDDSKIIDLFFERSEKAMAIYQLMVDIYKFPKLFMLRSFNGISLMPLPDLAYLGAWNAIPPERPNPLVSYICRLVRNISINRYKYNTASKRKGAYDLCLEELENCLSISGRNEIDDLIDESVLAAYIDEFLNGLGEINRMIFVRRFWYMDSYKAIAKASRLKEGAVRVRMVRVKSDLKEFLKEKGIAV